MLWPGSSWLALLVSKIALSAGFTLGAGVIGASLAYFLTQRGIAVTVIERTGVACAASGKSGGFIALDWCDNSPLGPLARASCGVLAPRTAASRS